LHTILPREVKKRVREDMSGSSIVGVMVGPHAAYPAGNVRACVV
jgi:hypothetical protein